MSSLESKVACDVCTATLAPTDWFLTNSKVRDVLDWIAAEVCIKEGIEGGKKSVCDGAVSMMAKQLLPAIAEGILSPQRVCDEYLHLCKNP